MLKSIIEIFVIALGSLLLLTAQLPFFEGVYQRMEDLAPPETLKIIFFSIGFSVVSLYVPVRNHLLRIRFKKYREFLHRNLDNLREVHVIYLSQKFSNEDFSEVSFRFFTPKKTVGFYSGGRFGQTVFVYQPLHGLCKDHISEPLEFVVHPKSVSQGLIGMTYCERGIGIKSGVADDERYQQYYNNMTQYQNTIASDHQFVLTIPILDNRDNIIAIMSVDAESPINGIDNESPSSMLALAKFAREFYLRVKPVIKF